MNIVAIVQARLGSTRFPKKVLEKIGNYTMIELINHRLKKSQFLNNIVFSISANKENKELELHLIENQIDYLKEAKKCFLIVM